MVDIPKELTMYGWQMDYARKNRNKFVDEWKRKNQDWCQDARDNGWWFCLEKELRNRANFIAQTEYRSINGSGQCVRPIELSNKLLNQLKTAFSGGDEIMVDLSAEGMKP